jgi:hypothetical protein
MGKFLKAFEAEKPGSPLDGVDGAEDFANQAGVLRPLFEFCQAAFHPVQAFLALNQKLSCQFIH